MRVMIFFSDTYLDSLTLEWLIRIVDVLERDAVELSLVDVRYPVVLPSLGRTDGTFQIVSEADVGESANGDRGEMRINKKVPSNCLEFMAMVKSCLFVWHAKVMHKPSLSDPFGLIEKARCSLANSPVTEWIYEQHN